MQLLSITSTVSDPIGHQNLQILVADDSRVSRLVTSNFLLSRWRVDLRVVEGGEEAVRATNDWDFDLILMDVEMPGMDGFEATKRIRLQEQCRQTPRRVPVMAYTSLALTAADHRLMTCGMDDVVAKPLEASSMLECLQRWCHGTPSPASMFAPWMRF